jgi:hypothetical protein
MNGYIVTFAVVLATFAYLAGCFRGYGKGFRDHEAILPASKLSPLLDKTSKFLRSLAPYDTQSPSYKVANELDDVLDVIDPICRPNVDHPIYRDHERDWEETFNPEFHKKA